MDIFPFWTLQTGTVYHPFWRRLFLLSSVRLLPGENPLDLHRMGIIHKVILSGRIILKREQFLSFWVLPGGHPLIRDHSNYLIMAENDFEKGTNFLFLYGHCQVRIPSNLGWGPFKVILLWRRIILKREIFLQAEEKTLSIIGMSYKVAHNVFDKEEENNVNYSFAKKKVAHGCASCSLNLK